MTTAGLSTARRALVAALLAVMGGLAAADGARAQYDDREVEVVLPPRAVVAHLGRQGFTALGRPRFDGVAYVVEAESRWGNRVRLFVDARSGAILERERLEAPLYPPGRVGPPGYGWTEEEAVVRPPRPVMREAVHPAPDAAPRNPFASNYPSRQPTRGEVAAAAPPPRDYGSRDPNPQGLNPQGLNPRDLNPQGLPQAANPEQPASRRAEPRRTAKLAPPRPETAPALKPAETGPKPATPEAASAAPARPAPATPAVAEVAKPATPAPVREMPGPARPVRVIGGVTPVPGAPDKPETKPASD